MLHNHIELDAVLEKDTLYLPVVHLGAKMTKSTSTSDVHLLRLVCPLIIVDILN